MEQFIEFLYSFKWLYLLVFIFGARYISKLINCLQTYLRLQQDIYIKDSKFDFDDTITTLHKLIEDILENYRMYTLIPSECNYITNKMEIELKEYVCDEISQRMSTLLIRKLELIFNINYIGKYISQTINTDVTSFVVRFNMPKGYDT